MAVRQLGILVAVLMLLSNASLMAQDDRTVLADKVVVVYLKSDPKAGAVLENTVVQNLGDRYFLVGSGVDLGDPTRAGLIQWIPVDDIGRIHQFQDVAELRNRTRMQQ